MRVAETARNHLIEDEDMLHAAGHAIAHWPMDEGFAMLVGPDRTGDLLEVGLLGIDSDDPVIVHAMKCRPKFLPQR